MCRVPEGREGGGGPVAGGAGAEPDQGWRMHRSEPGCQRGLGAWPPAQVKPWPWPSWERSHNSF